MAGGDWTEKRALHERLSRLVSEDRFLVVEEMTVDRDLGFGGGTTHTVAVTVHGPAKQDRLYVWAERSTFEQAVKAIEDALR